MQDVFAAYQSWLNDYCDDPELTGELAGIADQPAEIEDRFNQELCFGTGGLRGVIGAGPNRINIYVVRRATLALARVLLEAPDAAARGVVIGYDSRLRSADFAREAALVLAAAGMRVYLFDALRPVPELSFAVRDLGCAAGIEITASHNPPQYNGYKVYNEDGGQITPDFVARMRAHFPTIAYNDVPRMTMEAAEACGRIQTIGAALDARYLAAIAGLAIDPEMLRAAGRELKLVYTPLNGAGNMPVRRLLANLGLDNVFVVAEQEKPDGHFPTLRVPNPEDPAAFQYALKIMEREQADLCLATDPDCDRIGVACRDSRGDVRILSGDQLGCVLADYVLGALSRKGRLPADAAVVTTIVSTGLGDKICAHYGAASIRVLTGFKYIADQITCFEKTRSHSFVFGFEESCGYLSGTDVRDKDGVNACLLAVEAAAWHRRQGRTLADAYDALEARFGHYSNLHRSYVFKGMEGKQKMDAIMELLRHTPPACLGTLPVQGVCDYRSGERRDGSGMCEALTLPRSNVLLFELAQGNWVCLRPSGTEPKLKIYINLCAESADEARTQGQALMDAVCALLPV